MLFRSYFSASAVVAGAQVRTAHDSEREMSREKELVLMIRTPRNRPPRPTAGRRLAPSRLLGVCAESAVSSRTNITNRTIWKYQQVVSVTGERGIMKTEQRCRPPVTNTKAMAGRTVESANMTGPVMRRTTQAQRPRWAKTRN